MIQKENEGLYSRIEEMNKAASEKFDHLKNIEQRQATAEKETSNKMREIKNRQKEKINEL